MVGVWTSFGAITSTSCVILSSSSKSPFRSDNAVFSGAPFGVNDASYSTLSTTTVREHHQRGRHGQKPHHGEQKRQRPLELRRRFSCDERPPMCSLRALTPPAADRGAGRAHESVRTDQLHHREPADGLQNEHGAVPGGDRRHRRCAPSPTALLTPRPPAPQAANADGTVDAFFAERGRFNDLA